MENSEIQLAYKVKKNQVKMLFDRGFKIEGIDGYFLNDQFTFQYFLQSPWLTNQPNSLEFYERLGSCYSHSSNANNKIQIIFIDEKDKKNISQGCLQTTIKNFENLRFKNNIKSLILVCRHLITPAVISTIEKQQSDDRHIEIIYFNQLSYKASDHCLVPKHVLATKEELNYFKNKEDLPSLPKIFMDDPIVVWYGWKPGDLIKIFRHELIPNVPVKETIEYRLVIKRKKGKEYTSQTIYKFI